VTITRIKKNPATTNPPVMGIPPEQ